MDEWGTLPEGADGFWVTQQYLSSGSDTPYRVSVMVSFPATDDLAPEKDPFHEGMRMVIENMVMLRLLDEATKRARHDIEQAFPGVAPVENL